MRTSVPSTGRRDRAIRSFLLTVGAYLLWVAVEIWRSGATDPEGLVYLVPPLILLAGVLLGRCCAQWEGSLLVPITASVLAAPLALLVPFYENALAIVGVQLVAVAGLLLTVDVGRRPRPRLATAHMGLSVVVGTLGILLAGWAQAAAVLVVAVVIAIASALRRIPPGSRSVVVGAGLGAVGVAASMILLLATLPVWPRQLEDGGSLSSARRDLWRDAVALWGEHPLFGGGPGSFYESSTTARSEDHLYAAHSSLLQVASELGAIGAVLFLGVLVAGAVLAASGDRARGLIGVAAWSALAVHSMIDHLYEFPLVCLLAGVVIGWAGARGAVGSRDEGRKEHSRAVQLT